MRWKLDKNRPLCPQIEEQICVLIAKGELTEGDKLFSVREVAVGAGVNPNTVQKAFEALEINGLIYSVRGSGWYVTDSKEKAVQIVNELTESKTKAYFEEMKLLGIGVYQIKEFVKEFEI